MGDICANLRFDQSEVPLRDKKLDIRPTDNGECGQLAGFNAFVQRTPSFSRQFRELADKRQPGFKKAAEDAERERGIITLPVPKR